MISEHSIQDVLERADIVEVIGEFVELKQAGSNWKGLSPFTAEKTPSFMVSPKKQIFKDFSSGAGGGVVAFLKRKKGWSYPEVIKYLAEKYNVQLQYEGKEQTAEEKNELERLQKCLDAAAHYYQKALWELRPKDANERLALSGHDHPVYLELEGRRLFSVETLIDWGLGYAPDEWRFLTEKIIPNGYFKEAETLGLCGHKNKRNYDIYRNRIIFPIHDHVGNLVGFGARSLDGSPPKYLNSKENKIYKKNRVLYGLNKAIDAIREEGFAYLVEGYTDVISMHQNSIANTVATCGTSLTVEHAKLLKRYTKHIVLLRDADAAGTKAARRDFMNLVKYGFKVDICKIPGEVDPDDLCRQFIYA